MQFRNLTIGQTFDWINDATLHNSFYKRCTKVGNTTYQDADGHYHSVGTTRAEVFHVGALPGNRDTGRWGYDADRIAQFAASWPAHGFPTNLDRVICGFEKGDLVEVACFDAHGRSLDSHDFDGPALLAMVGEIQSYGLDESDPRLAHKPAPREWVAAAVAAGLPDGIELDDGDPILKFGPNGGSDIGFDEATGRFTMMWYDERNEDFPTLQAMADAAKAEWEKTRARPGTVSHGTLREEDLIPAFADLLERLATEAQKVEVKADEHIDLANKARGLILERESPEAIAEWVNDLFDALDTYAPAGHSFGAHEGDGSDFGFWPNELDDEPADVHDGEFIGSGDAEMVAGWEEREAATLLKLGTTMRTVDLDRSLGEAIADGTVEAAMMHEGRVADVCAFLEKGIDRKLTDAERQMVDSINEQILHLMSAAITEAA